MKKAFLLSIIVFVVITILFSWWFIHVFGHNAKLGIATLRNIVVDRAFLISIPTSIAYFSIHMLVITEKNKWILAAMIVLILIALYAVLAYFYFFNVIIVSLLENPFVD